MNKSFLALIVMVVGSLSLAQTSRLAPRSRHAAPAITSGKKAEATPLAQVSPQSTECAFTFTSGSESSNNSLKYCVTANGNLIQLETPVGVQFVSRANHGEGYGICDVTPNVGYSDFGGFGDSGNWGAATVLSHSAKAVKIARTTSDGIWTLTQTITKVGGTSPSAKIAMALRNNSSNMRTAVLVRYADVDATGIAINNFSGTGNSALGWNSTFGAELPYGLLLQNLSPSQDITAEGFARDTAAPPNPCLPLAHFPSKVLTATDGSLEMFYEASVRPHAAVTFTAAYKGW